MAATDLYDLCKEYLDACSAALAGTPGGTIDRAYVSPGSPPWDCPPQLTVHAGGPAEADTAPTTPPLAVGHRTQNQGLVNLVTMTATVLRCTPAVSQSGGKVILPRPSELDAAAQQTMADLWAIWNYVRTQYKAEALFVNSLGLQRELFFDPAVSLAQAGGAGGWEIQIRVQLDGYRTT